MSTSAAPASLEGQIIGGRWRVGPVIGKGGVGAVYRGEHVGTERRVAIKVLHASYAKQTDFRKRFEREARAASKLSHPACVSVLDFGEHEGRLFLVMEYADGHLLEERIRAGRLQPSESVGILRGIAIALRHAHALEIVHRDIKPANVMLLDHAQSGVTCKLLDFGGAKSMSGDPKESLTMRGQVFCTLSYLSPEQAVGNPADARSDLYALGVVGFEMLTGRKPFSNRDDALLIQDHIRTPAPRVRDLVPAVSRELDGVIARLLEKRPEARFASAELLLDALGELPEAGGKLEIPMRRPPVWAIALSGAVVLLILVWIVIRLVR